MAAAESTKQRKVRERRGALMTLQQGEAESGVPYTTLRDAVLRGHIRRVELGDSKRIWIRRSELERLIAGE